jgi:DNA modification methylase
MNKIEFGDCRETMRRWKEQGIKAQTCVTSPPYFGLRDYGTAKWEGGDDSCEHSISMPTKWNDPKRGTNVLRPETGHRGGTSKNCHKCGAARIDDQLGLEETPEEYITAMVEVFRCVWDVLQDDGTLWVNIGDSWASTAQGTFNAPQKIAKENATVYANFRPKVGLAPKNLIGIPWRLAFALQADGWILRQDIIWNKPNPMPESVQDRCTKSHEYIFLLSKKQKYYYDIEPIREPIKDSCDATIRAAARIQSGPVDIGNGQEMVERRYAEIKGANKRSVWTVNTKPYAGAHFAVFPTELIEPCILAGAPVGGVVLDPFMGSGTTAQVAQDLGRQYLGCELNLAYKPLQDKRISQLSLELV